MIRSPQWSCLRKGGLVIILILILNIMSIVGRLHGFKVIMLMFLLFAFDSVCIWSKQIVNTFCKSSNQQLKNKTPFHKWSSSKFQSRPVSCQILRLSLSLEAPSLARLKLRFATFWVSAPCQHMWQGRHSLGSEYSHWWTMQICGRYFTLSLWGKWWLMLASSKVLRAEMHSPTLLVNMLGAPWNFWKSIENDLFTWKISCPEELYNTFYGTPAGHE